jgi:aspartate racemase
MNVEEDNVIGIVGGMGPKAGLVLFDSILCHTRAVTDQQHLSAILMSFPRHIVDRTSFLEGVSHINPAYNIAEIISKLEKAGAKVAGIACNTSHSPEIYNVILAELYKTNSRIKLVNMPFETCRYIQDNHPNVRRVGVMTTNGTYKSGIYKQLLQNLGYEVIMPDFEFQNDIIHKMIYDQEFGLKSNASGATAEARSLLDKALRFFRNKKSDLIILGCTDLSFMLADDIAGDMLVVDSTESLAIALIREARALKMNGNPEVIVSPVWQPGKRELGKPAQ